MSNLRKSMMVSAAALLSVAISGAANAATYTYVGNWHVGDGPAWATNPAVLNAQETAALLFGGTAADYAISTIDNNPLNINFMSFVDGWGDSQYLTNAVAQNFSLDSGAPGYNDPYGGPSYSAYVQDHSCFNRYSNPAEMCGAGEPGLNFAFRVDGAVPESSTWAMMIAGFGVAGTTLRYRRRKTAVSFG